MQKSREVPLILQLNCNLLEIRTAQVPQNIPMHQITIDSKSLNSLFFCCISQPTIVNYNSIYQKYDETIYLLLLISSHIRMGVSTGKTFDQDPDVAYQKLQLSPEDLKRIEMSPNKPLSGYAYITDKRPAIFPEVQITLAEQLQMKLTEPEKRGEALPCCILAAMPGCYYQGEWLKGRPSGYGKVYAKNGIYYEGGFQGGLANCIEGILVYADGSFYRGSFKDNCFSGKGYFEYRKNKTKYQGDWAYDKPQGRGIENYEDKSRYEGQFKDGLRHGKGKYTFSDGRIYNGQFIMGQFTMGRLIQKGSKGVYDGKFENGYKVGNTLATEHGTYSGKFVNGLMHDPNAKFKWYDGMEYSGPFQFGEMHGEGRIKCVGGQEIVGRWVRGRNVAIVSFGTK